jgi:hypothetical protein
MTYEKHDVIMLSLKSTNEILSSTDALKDISWG